MEGNIPAAEITEDWKKVLFNQFHDLAAGSGIGVIYKDAQKDYDWVRLSTNEISCGALKTVAEGIDTTRERGNSSSRLQPAWMGALQEMSRSTSHCLQALIQGCRRRHADEGFVPGSRPRRRIVSRDENKVLPSCGSCGQRAGIGLSHSTSGESAPEVARGLGTDRRRQGGLVLSGDELRVTVDKKSGCITILEERSRLDLIPRRLRQRTAIFQGHAQGIRRVEYRPGNT